MSGARTPSVAAPQATAPAGRGVAQPAPAGGRSGASAPAATSDQFAARESGETAGVTNQAGQQVFASSTAANGKNPAGAQAGAGSPAEGSAVSDAWSGFSSGGSTANGAGSTPAAALAGEQGSGATLGLAILGLGLVGLLGTFVVLAAPRRRLAEANRQRTRRRERGSDQ